MRDDEIEEEGRIATTPDALRRRFGSLPPCRVAIEAGTHSPWISRLLTECGHEVIVANPRRVRLIYENDNKSDRMDAQWLARIARMDPKLLAPIHHRSLSAQADWSVIRARDALVRSRKVLVNHVRGSVKAYGGRVPRCSVETLPKKAAPSIPEALQPALHPVLESITTLTMQVRTHERQIQGMKEKYPATRLLEQVLGVGTLTAMAYMLVIGDPTRFQKSRTVGAYVGLRTRRDQSGAQDPQRRITKAGNPMLRRLLVGSAQYILGPFGKDSDLRRYGLAIAARGGKNAKKRAVVAVARKLAVLLHRLWITGEVYDPLYQAHRK
jgi:transposase